MQPQPQAPPTIIVQMPQPAPPWISQQTATLLTGSAALIVLWFTIRHNWSKFYKEKEVERVSNRKLALEQQYGAFAAAAFRCTASIRHLISAQMVHQKYSDKMTEEVWAVSNARLDDNYAEIQSHEADMLAAYAHLQLLHDAPDCLAAAWRFYIRCHNLELVEQGKDASLEIDNELRHFLRSVSVRLLREYHEAIRTKIGSKVPRNQQPAKPIVIRDFPAEVQRPNQPQPDAQQVT